MGGKNIRTQSPEKHITLPDLKRASDPGDVGRAADLPGKSKYGATA